tara:strand:+ start:363 stop:854 length:492 start_codon:yes stop_codon:yes gene_type:complete
MIVANMPNSKFGLKFEKISTKKPIPRVMLVPIMALPVVRIVVVVDFSWLLVIRYSDLNLDKKCIVSSTAIPKAIEKVIAVAGLSSIPKNPITAPAKRSGIIFGIIETRDNFIDLNNIFIEINITIKAIIKLFNKLAMRYLFIFNASSVLPVTFKPFSVSKTFI